ALGREIISQALGGGLLILGEDERSAIIKEFAAGLGLRPGQAELALTRLKQQVHPQPSPELAPLWQAYENALAQRGALDLDDLVRRAVLALEEDPALAQAWGGRFDHVLVDEYQDSNPAQVSLLTHLLAGGASLTAIGDPDQAIYGFRGATREGFLRFAQDFSGAREIGLTRNYRNHGAILEAAQGLLTADPDPGRLALSAQAGQGVKPVWAELPSPKAEAAWVAAKIVELTGGLDSRQVERSDAGELAPRDIAVLYRLHAQAAPLAQALAQAGVPFQVAGQEPLGETDPLDFKAQRVSLLTLHAAKGLEFAAVFVVGVEESLLPYQPPEGEPSDMGEERRLLYVAMTRAKQSLFLSRAKARSLFGVGGPREASPLVGDIPAGALRRERVVSRRRAWQMDLFG
ncbi:MAG: ATP-dependent helicase, partial [Proteobacteria bacterium]|nr:ATP-dependent helicase [Pseudomonadota bacterium]